jgi:histidinol dehydrogenase
MSRPIKFRELAKLSSAERQRLLTRTEADLSHIMPKVQHIVEDVRTQGDKALRRFARELDRARIDDKALAATEGEFETGEKLVPVELREAMEFAANSITHFHTDQMPEEMWLHEIRPGAFAGDRIRPIPSVACYVPRG